MWVFEKLAGAFVDIVTCIASVSCWCGIWCAVDSLGEWTPPLAVGFAAVLMVVILVATNAHGRLELLTETWNSLIAKAAVWLWTSSLAVLSILIWRAGFTIMYHDAVLPPSNTPRAVSFAVLGFTVLAATGYLRSACEAPPFGSVSDCYSLGQRFAAASFSADLYGKSVAGTGALHDICLTVPVVFVWAGIWRACDNIEVPLLPSFSVCCLLVCVLGISDADNCMRGMARNYGGVVGKIGSALWCCILAVFSVMSWRAVWEALLLKGRLSSRPILSIAVALEGIVTLTLMQRHRSSLFPPMDFARDSDVQQLTNTHLSATTGLDAENLKCSQGLAAGYGAAA